MNIPAVSEIVTIIPVVISLIIIEGLLSVDNAMAIAAMASKLPKHQQTLALRLGIVGAYAFRGIAMLCVAWIINNPWLKILGSIYLIYLMCENLVQVEEEEEGAPEAKVKGLIATIISIELMDLSLSLDNVVAAVALDKRIWVVCTGVFIGILALRFLAGYCIKLIEKFPVLEKTAFLLVGFVGCILLTEIICEYQHIHVHINSLHKFIGIITIVALTIWYDATNLGKLVLTPIRKVGMGVIVVVDTVLGWALTPITLPLHYGVQWYRKLKTT